MLSFKLTILLPLTLTKVSLRSVSSTANSALSISLIKFFSALFWIPNAAKSTLLKYVEAASFFDINVFNKEILSLKLRFDGIDINDNWPSSDTAKLFVTDLI
jgi:hypothetical protein